MAGGVVEKPAAHDKPRKHYLNHVKTFGSWLVTLDHKRIAMMYLCAVSFALLLGGVFALALRTVLWNGTPADPETSILGATMEQFYNKMFTLHGAVMVFLFIIPGIPAALGNFILPMQLGAKDLALPRINLLSWYLYVMGLVLFVCVLVLGGLDTGWTLYPPYSMGGGSQSQHVWHSLVLAYMAVFILGFSSILTGLNFIVTMHKLRPPGMGMYDMPLFLWALYATSLIQVLATPVVGITLGLSLIEHMFHVGIFLPQYGGDPVMYQHFFWFYSHPAVYIMILPAMGVQSEIMGTFSRKHIFGYKAIAWSSIAIAAIGFIVWGHHMFVSGQSPTAGIIFSFLTYLVAIPSAIKVFNWVATMYKGSIDLKTPMIYGLNFIYLFGIGGLTGLFLASISNNVHLHDTYFVIAHFHMVMVGSTVNAFLGGVHLWWPKMTGRMYNETLGRIGAILVFVGFNLAFMPQFVSGTRGMPRRYANYLEEFTTFHQASTVGAYILGAGIGLQVLYLLYSLFKGKKAPDNPWGAASLEWQSESPPDFHNFTKPPIMMGAYDYENWEYESEEAGWKLKPEVIETRKTLSKVH
ncbi:MAG: cbb3-type cytochrome c oxidase subunit I [Planctomycetes bacterium]|nr:cbb3-type cytochrome c oxidase subunit I [Planctomycetota bacterium]MCW8136594.1 cbb3-type cytochrome c oxidase subunit I [Planctomycetota bacterium]